MSSMAVIYWSGTGNTLEMAEAVVAGAKEAGIDAELFAVNKITVEAASQYDLLALGCPSMGDEVLEETTFEPFFIGLEHHIQGKKVALFGSYGWGDGQWMRDWQQRVLKGGATLINDAGLICNGHPSADGLAACRALAVALIG